MWNRLVGWWWTFLPKNLRNPATWVLHGMLTALIVLPFALCGAPWTGFAVGVWGYTFREIESVLTHDVDWIDSIMDVVGPVVGGLLVVWALA